VIDSTESKQPQDPKTIDTHQDYEMGYWSKILGVSTEEIRKVVGEVGNSVEEVRKELDK